MQMLAADYFELDGYNYLVIVDRYSNWPAVFRVKAKEGADELCKLLRRHFATFGCPDELATDGGSQFVAEGTRKFLQEWKVRHRISSAYFPHSNLRAEQGVRTVKRILRNNVGPSGSLDCNEVAKALLNYRNTPDRDLKRSPAQIVFGRAIKDAIPLTKGRYRPSSEWILTFDQRERALGPRQSKMGTKWKEHTRELSQLKVGDMVSVQNQAGTRAKKWDKMGTVVESNGNRQYTIRMEGSGRLSVRNRRFLKPVGRCMRSEDDDVSRGMDQQSRPTRIRRVPKRFPLEEGDN